VREGASGDSPGSAFRTGARVTLGKGRCSVAGGGTRRRIRYFGSSSARVASSARSAVYLGILTA